MVFLELIGICVFQIIGEVCQGATNNGASQEQSPPSLWVCFGLQRWHISDPSRTTWQHWMRRYFGFTSYTASHPCFYSVNDCWLFADSWTESQKKQIYGSFWKTLSFLVRLIVCYFSNPFDALKPNWPEHWYHMKGDQIGERLMNNLLVQPHIKLLQPAVGLASFIHRRQEKKRKPLIFHKNQYEDCWQCWTFSCSNFVEKVFSSLIKCVEREEHRWVRKWFMITV